MLYTVKGKTTIYYVADYHPYRISGERNPAFDEASSLLLRFKEGKEIGFKFYADKIINMISQLNETYKFDGIAIIPSHEVGKYSESLLRLINILRDELRIDDKHTALSRIYTIDKLSRGGNRSIDNHIKSISVNREIVKGKCILLLDDVITTGHSMIAGEYLLNRTNANNVICASVAHTVYEHTYSED